jgi:hypothetical protein
MTTMLVHALGRAALGFRVFRLYPNSKLPYSGWQAEATSDPDKIRELWAPCSITGLPSIDGVGLKMGEFGDGSQQVFALDPDVKDGKDGIAEIAKLELENGELPDTYEQRTPSGGRHIVMLSPEPIQNNNTGRFAHGVDIKGGGAHGNTEGFIVGAGTLINDVPYTGNDRPPAMASEWALARCRKPPREKAAPIDTSIINQERAIDWAVGYLKGLEPVGPGQPGGRHGAFYKIAAKLKDRGLTEANNLATMREHWPCNPMLDDDEMERTMADLYEAGENPIGCSAPEIEFDPIDYDPEADIPAPDMPRTDPRAEFDRLPITLSEILKREAKPVEYIVPGLMKNIVNALDGPGGSHKSRFAMQTGLVVAAGGVLLGAQTAKCTAVHLSSEDDLEELTRRAQMIARRLDLPPGGEMIFWDRTGEDSTIVEASEGGIVKPGPFYNRLHEKLRSIPGHKYLILDSLPDYVRYIGKAKLDEGAVNAVIKGPLTKLCQECDCTILTIRHPSQAGQERGDQSGWSVAHNNSIRSRLSLVRVERGRDTFTLTREKTNHSAAGKTWTLTYSEGALVAPDGIRDAEQSARVYDAVIEVAIAEALAGQPFTTQKNPLPSQIDRIAEACGVRLTGKDIKDKLSIAVRAGKLRYQKSYGRDKAGFFPTVEKG